MLNQVQALDFMHDALYDGRAIRILNVIDKANREVLAVAVGTRIPAIRVVNLLKQRIEMHGAPAHGDGCLEALPAASSSSRHPNRRAPVIARLGEADRTSSTKKRARRLFTA